MPFRSIILYHLKGIYMKNQVLKFGLVICLLGSFAVGEAFADGKVATKEEMQKQIEMLKAQMEAMAKAQKEAAAKAASSSSSSSSSSGLKVQDMNNQEMGRSPASTQDAQPQISPEQMQQLQDALKKGQDYLKERNEFLQELDNEDL